METPANNKFPKKERLSGKTGIGLLLSEGRWTQAGCLKCCYLRKDEAEVSRLLVSVPKKLFKRAVRRNRLKRRIRESYRLQKAGLGCKADFMIVYNTKEELPFADIYASVGSILAKISTPKTPASDGQQPD